MRVGSGVILEKTYFTPHPTLIYEGGVRGYIRNTLIYIFSLILTHTPTLIYDSGVGGNNRENINMFYLLLPPTPPYPHILGWRCGVILEKTYI
jgi:hypothetical protein